MLFSYNAIIEVLLEMAQHKGVQLSNGWGQGSVVCTILTSKVCTNMSITHFSIFARSAPFSQSLSHIYYNHNTHVELTVHAFLITTQVFQPVILQWGSNYPSPWIPTALHVHVLEVILCVVSAIRTIFPQTTYE